MVNILFLGRGMIANACFGQLITDSTFYVPAIVSDVGFASETHDLWNHKCKYISNDERREDRIIECISKYQIQYLLSVQHPWILSPEIIEAIHGKALNLHNAKLPEYKGHNTITHAIMNEEKTYSSTIHWIDPKVDCGDIAFEGSFPILPNDTAWSVYIKSISIAVKNFTNLLQCIKSGTDIPRITQIGEGHYYAKNDIEQFRAVPLDSLSSDNIDKRIKALTFPGKEPVYFTFNSRKVYLSYEFNR